MHSSMCTVGQERDRGGTGCALLSWEACGAGATPRAELYEVIGNVVYQGPAAAAGSSSEGMAWSHDSLCL